MTKKGLSLKEFSELERMLQFKALHRNGVYVGKRRADEQVIVLFQLHGFYVEVHYKEYRKIIDHLVITDSTDILHPYLDQINLKGLRGDGGPVEP